MKFVLLLALISVAVFCSDEIISSKFSPSTNEIDQLALTGINNYLARINTILSFEEVLSCKTQVVAGKNYFLQVSLRDSQGDSQLYQIDIYVVPWEKKASIMQFKHLGAVEKQDQIQVEEQVKPEREGRPDGGFVTLDWYSQDAELSEIKSETELVLNEYIAKQNLNKEYKVLKASVQVVSGMNVNLLISIDEVQYNVSIYLQPWTNTRMVRQFIKVGGERKQISAKKFLNKKKSDSLIGETQEIDFYAEEQLIKTIVLEKLSERVNSANIQVTKATKKVVSGLLYNLTFTVNNEVYNADVIVQLWNNNVIVKNLKSSSPSSNSTGFIKEDIKKYNEKDSINFDQENYMMKDLVFKALSSRINSNSITVTKASRQMVSGVMYNLQFTNGVENFEADVLVQLWNQNNQVKIMNFQQI